VPVWKQQPTDKLNYLCDIPDCHSNCPTSRLVALIGRLLRLRCGKCNHPYRSHSHSRYVWVPASDTRPSADEGRKQAATNDKKNAEALIATRKRAFDDLNRIIGESMDDLARFLAEYDGTSLSGSFSVHMEKASRLLEQRYTDMEKKGASKEQLRKTRDSLGLMERKLVLLRDAEKAQET